MSQSHMSKIAPHYVPSAMQEARSLLRHEDLDACKRRVTAWIAMNSGKERQRHEATLRALESIEAEADCEHCAKERERGCNHCCWCFKVLTY